jgi:hypothetical protein
MMTTARMQEGRKTGAGWAAQEGAAMAAFDVMLEMQREYYEDLRDDLDHAC